MGTYFSDIVEKAIEDLYYCYDNDRAGEAADCLAYAATEQEDGDACYVLARCFSNACQSWKYHPFEENLGAVYAMLRKGIFLGSSAAVVGAVRMDMLKGELLDIMPFSHIREPFQEILEKAQGGCPFCQFLAGNAFYYLDIIKFEEKDPQDFDTQQQWEAWQIQQIETGVSWYEKAFDGGMGLAGRNLIRHYKNGREGVIPPDPLKADEIVEKGARLGYADCMFDLAWDLYFVKGRQKEGMDWAMKAARMGHLEGWRIQGDALFSGETGKADLSGALDCYEKVLAGGPDAHCSDRAGQLCFLGPDAQRDYQKAVKYLEQSYALQGNNARIDMLGVCLLLGWGCKEDPVRGKMLLEEAGDSPIRSYGLGVMHADGITVPEDIKKGIAFLKEAGDYKPAMEAMARFKKGLFGRWKRR